MTIVVFEDEHVPRLYPVTFGRPAYAISCGSFRLLDWLKQLGKPITGVVRSHLAQIQVLDYPELSGVVAASSEKLLFVNARLVPSRTNFEVLRKILKADREGIVSHDGELAIALVSPNNAVGEKPLTVNRMPDAFKRLGVEQLAPLDHELSLLQYPHDIVRYNMQVLLENLEYRLSIGSYKEIADGVYVGENARLGQYAVTDTTKGPVILESEAVTGPFCYLNGPAYIGHGAKLIEHAAVKDAVSIGHTTKIGGEVEASVIEPYTNKQHHGFLGHSYLGSWINLGAGTCNSDLKNTYGTVNVDHQGEKVATGMQFVGCIIGDYSKSAINTSIFTGKSIGVCSMLYGFVTTNVPSYVNYARLFGQVTELPPEVMIATQQRMFRRRKVEQRPCDVQLLHDMYELSRDERQLAGDPLSL
ncbi:MAG: glucose-1-phosphate thymidylyltransferase [Planctomycetaceae bacterium]|nr:glucose-1-phosphate thymidylyltransferase [Planctomycetaceae bacterium]